MKKLIALALSLVVLGTLAPSLQAAGGREKDVQHVKLTVGDSGYVVTPAKVTKGVPVKMDVDLQTVKGCARTVVINAVGVKKTVTQDAATIEFTPTKTGPIEIVCGMNMVKGRFTVVGR